MNGGITFYMWAGALKRQSSSFHICALEQTQQRLVCSGGGWRHRPGFLSEDEIKKQSGGGYTDLHRGFRYIAHGMHAHGHARTHTRAERSTRLRSSEYDQCPCPPLKSYSFAKMSPLGDIQ